MNIKHEITYPKNYSCANPVSFNIMEIFLLLYLFKFRTFLRVFLPINNNENYKYKYNRHDIFIDFFNIQCECFEIE